MSSLSQFAQSGKIKSIQRGTISISANNTSSSVTISSVDTTKSVLHYLGTNDALSYRSSLYYSINRSAYLTLTNSTTITASGADANSSNQTLVISWQLVEYY